MTDAEYEERRAAYAEYLQSQHWLLFRRRVRKSHCFCCGKQVAPNGCAVHHITYERLGAERDSDVVTVCHFCHEQIHRSGLPLKVAHLRVRSQWHPECNAKRIKRRNARYEAQASAEKSRQEKRAKDLKTPNTAARRRLLLETQHSISRAVTRFSKSTQQLVVRVDIAYSPGQPYAITMSVGDGEYVPVPPPERQAKKKPDR